VVYGFGEYLLDDERRELRRAGGLVEVEPQVFDLLRYLLQNRERLVSKDELFQHVWQGRAVSESALATRLNAARKAVGDSGTAQRVIRTSPRKGLRFVADVVERVRGAPSWVSSATAGETPSIGVVPFAAMSGDSQSSDLADAVVQEIVTVLTRIGWLSVVVGTGPANPGRLADALQAGRTLGVSYLLTGSVRRHGQQVRTTSYLIEASSGTCLWSDRFDGAVEDVFHLPDRVAAGLTDGIGRFMQASDVALDEGGPPSNRTAYDLSVHAKRLYVSAARHVPPARALLEQAISLDPDYGPALAWAGICCFRMISDGRSADPAADRRRGIEFARRALATRRADPVSSVNAAQALAFFDEDRRIMATLVEQVLMRNPTVARCWLSSAAVQLFAGEPDAAIEHAKMVQRLSPNARVGPAVGLVGMGYFFSRRFDEAIPALHLALEDDPSYPQPYRYLAACYAYLGQLRQAGAVIERLRAITPVVAPDVSYLQKSEHRELYLSGIVQAAQGSR